MESSIEKIKLSTIILMVASLPFSTSLKIISLFILLFILAHRLYRKETKIEMSAMHYGFIFILVSALLSSIFAENPVKSLKGTKDVLYYTIPFFVGSTIVNEEQSKKILWSLYISTGIASLLGIIHSLRVNRPLEIHTLGNQNYTAMFLVIVILSMIATIVLSNKETKLQKCMIGIFLVLSLIAAIMTVMRTSFIGLFIFIVILLFTQKRLKSITIVSATVTLLTLAAAYYYKPMWGKLLFTQSLISRFDYLWQHAIKVFKENPFIGIGLNHFKYTFPPGYMEQKTLFDAHSIYLQTASQMGIFGVISLFMIIFGFLHAWLRYRPVSGFQKAVKYSALGGFLVTFVGGIFDTTLRHEHAIAFTLLAGLMFGIQQSKNMP